MKPLNKNKKIIFSLDEYKKYKREIKEIINQLSNHKSKEDEKECIEFLKSYEQNKLFFEHLFFANYEKLMITSVNLNIFSNDNDNILFYEQLKSFKLLDKNLFDEKLLKIIFHMYLYLVINIINSIQILAKSNVNEGIIENKVSRILIRHSLLKNK